MRILIINPGSTSTKLAVYEDGKPIWTSGAHHKTRELSEYHSSTEQYALRMDYIRRKLAESDIPVRFDAVIARGGLLTPLTSGVYRVNGRMKHDLLHAKRDHACNLGALLADELAAECGCPAFIADPVVVDEMDEVARYTGLPGIERKSIFHALNSKAVCRRYVETRVADGRRYEDMDIIVAHLGGGISISAHRHGRVVDVNNALDGDGPFSTERAGTIPTGDLVEMCFSGKYSEAQMKSLLHGKGGLTAYLGTNDMVTISSKAEDGEYPYNILLDSMIYNIAKQCGAMHVALDGQTEVIILTGGMAHSRYITSRLENKLGCIAPTCIIPGENEIESLAYNAFAVMTGKLEAKEYCPPDMHEQQM